MTINGVQRDESCYMTALPPWCQVEKEMDAIAKDESVRQELDGEVIIQIKRIENDSERLYQVISMTKSILAAIHYLPQPIKQCGPALFEVYVIKKE